MTVPISNLAGNPTRMSLTNTVIARILATKQPIPTYLGLTYQHRHCEEPRDAATHSMLPQFDFHDPCVVHRVSSFIYYFYPRIVIYK